MPYGISYINIIMSKPWRDSKINVQWIMFLYCLSVRILAFVIGALQMESSGVKGISDVPLEQACLCHWIKSPFQLLKSSTSELVRHGKSHHRVLCQENVWQMITFGAILTWDQALFFCCCCCCCFFGLRGKKVIPDTFIWQAVNRSLIYT